MTVNVIRNYVNKYDFAVDSVDALVNSRRLSSLGEVYVQSFYDGWQATTAGPKGGHLVHTTGGTASSPTVPPAVSVGTIGSGAQLGYYWDLDGVEWFFTYQGYVSPEMFGAYGDGVTNDTDAIYNVGLFIQNQGGGVIEFFPKTYIVGEQTINPSPSTPYYNAKLMLWITGCTNPLVINGNGAILKVADGLAFGGFDPVTGLTSADVSGNVNYRARIQHVIALYDNLNSVSISDIEIDGNIGNLNIGGAWGPEGRQIAADGVYIYGNASAHLKNVYTHHNALDGLEVGWVGATETSDTKPVVLENVVSQYNARQGLSWVGGKGLTAISCDFSYTGRSGLVTSPTAGVDIEAESAIVRNGTFINCTAIDNAGPGMLIDTGDVAHVDFENCKFVGTTNWALWPKKPFLSFTDCTIVGPTINTFQSTNREEGNKFYNCFFTDNETLAPGGSITAAGILVTADQAAGTRGVVFDSCYFQAGHRKVGFFRNGVEIKDCYFELTAGTDYIANRDYALFFATTTIDNIYIYENITLNPPADAYFVQFNGFDTTRNYSFLEAVNSKLLWNTWNPAGNGYQGELGVGQSVASKATRLNRQLRVDTRHGTQDLYSNTVIPVSGTFKQGDVVFNDAPVAGGKVGWVCVTAGTPGTWKAFGAIDP